ncbi:hypothetical protein H181DRAFT_02697 [Streptomyces sp. WMMB 714]|uniref:hypothetical protein n=1 Tax=Streptomyces sp. WMMB 714 TaxID=1286822 RepID=UPI0005F88FCE|nr:hypothetical protein [Streptomyces sp. WMMB 714]SCK33125.1 hypothetical protein H181DRAFT_02697 [Streptomyces sp. WMMB 714]
MSRAAATELLDALEPLAHRERIRLLCARAREAAGSDELAGLLDGLEQHGMYGRRLAVIAASAGRDHAHLSARLAHPDAFVRGHAQRAAVAPSGGITDDALLQALHAAPAAIRAELLRTIVAGGRSELADGLIDVLRTRWGDAEAARLLPGCGGATVERLLPELFHTVAGWGALAGRHPGAVLAESARQLDELPPVLRELWWDRYAAGVARTAAARPEEVLGLLERYRERLPLPLPFWPQLPRLVAADPGRTVRLLLADEHSGRLLERGLPPAVLRRLVRADAPELYELGRAWSRSPKRFAELLRALPPGRRAAFYDAVTEDEDRSHERLDEEVLDALPHERREAEAQRMAQQARDREAHWATVLAAVAHLPGQEAREELEEATRRPAAEDRARAWPLLVRQTVRAARRGGGDHARVNELLAAMARLRNEQDAVRWSALNALTSLPPRLLTDEAADHLDRLTGDAVQAPDSSHETREVLGRLAGAVLREHVASGRRALVGWALRTIVRLTGDTGGADLGRLDRTLPRGQEHTVHESLRYWLEAGAEKDDHGLTFALARAVGARADDMPELQELLWQAVQFGSEANARAAVGLWLRDPRARDARAADVLSLDASAAVLPAVSRTLCRRRTDLLDTVLGEAPPYGRFLTKDDTPPMPPVGRWTDRWLPRQQRAAAQLLAHEADDDTNGMARRKAALSKLAHVPGEGARELRLWVNDWVEDEAELAESAMAALVRTDRPEEALPALLAHTAEGRARNAVRALAHACRFLAPSQLTDVVRGLLLPPGENGGRPGAAPGAEPSGTTGDARREPSPESLREESPAGVAVAARRQAVRLAASMLPVSEAAEVLLAAYELPGQHVDVRAACVTSAAQLLDDRRAWQVIASAAEGEPVLCQAVLRTRPLHLPERHRERYARIVTGLGGAEDPQVAETVHSSLAHWAPWAPAAADVLANAVTDLSNRGTWQYAADGLVELAAALPGSASTFTDVVSRLIASDADPHTPDADPDRDRPARRRVEHIVFTLGRRAGSHRNARQAAGQTGVLLAGHEEFVPLAARLLCSAVDLGADEETLARQLRGIAGLHAQLPGQAWRTADELRRTLQSGHRPSGSSERLLRVARGLVADGGHASGLLAVALAAAVNPRSGWSEPWRAFLRDVRRHEVPDVRVAALEVATATGE